MEDQTKGSAAQAPSAADYSGVRVPLGQDIEILAGQQRRDIGTAGALAFQAINKKTSIPHVAILCEPALSPRLTSIPSYKNMKNPHLMRLVESGIIHWVPQGRELLALVYEMPESKRLLETAVAKPFPVAEDKMLSTLVRPLLSALSDFRNADMVHGAIRLDNIYMTGVDGMETLVLGECLSTAPFFRPGALYETIERAMARPQGRGSGSAKNDMYALGICLAIATRGENPLAGLSDEDIIRHKIENGSSSLISRERLPDRISELLFGLLNDDEQARWDIDQALRWLEERPPAGKQSNPPQKAARPFIFLDRKHVELRGLAMSFVQHPAEAFEAMEKNQFDLWVKRNFEDPKLHERLAAAAGVKEDMQSADRRMAGLVMAMDPHAPVRFRELAFMPSAFGVSLAHAMARGEELQSYADALSFQYPTRWINQIFEEVPDASSLLTNFDKCRNYLQQKMPGAGLERIVYMLNKEAACLSPLLEKSFVSSPAHLLPALEAMVKRGQKPENILDRHMIAYLSVREPKMIDPYMGHIISRDRAFQLIGCLRALSAVQKRFGARPVPEVGRWIISMLGPVLDRFNDRDLQAELKKRLDKMSEPGDMSAILALIDNETLIADDTQRFAAARQEHAALVVEYKKLSDQLKARALFGLDTGRQVAMVFSAYLGVCCAAGYIILHFINGGY